jgi:hypothetical protein
MGARPINDINKYVMRTNYAMVDETRSYQGSGVYCTCSELGK